MKFLFSPIGGTDPISNERDGSFLHICRIYKPDKVYMFFSKEIYEYHLMDSRYIYCLEKLGEALDHNFEYEIIIEKELSEVQEYNYFYRKFRNIIKDIINDMQEEDILYLNTSSGTPAMKSALMVMSAVNEYKFIPIQVRTPAKSMNLHHEDKKDYIPELQWECNRDNEEDYFENRCKEVECENLLLLLKIDLIRKFVNAYDYRAARMVAEEIKSDLTVEAYHLLVAAEARFQLDKSVVDINLKEISYGIIPVRSGNQRDIIEYLLVLDLKVRKGEYADFLRGITPVMADLFEHILKNKCDFNVDEYCSVRWQNGQRIWNHEKLKENKVVWDILNSNYTDGFNGKDLSSDHMHKLIVGLCTDIKLRAMVTNLRDIEMAVRNTAAHEVVSVTERWIKTKTSRIKDGGFTPQQILKIMKDLCYYAGLPMGETVWKSYDKMNEIISRSLDK